MEQLAGTYLGSTGHIETSNLTANILTDRLLELLGREDVQETARLYFEGGDVTINLIWSALVVGALLLCE